MAIGWYIVHYKRRDTLVEMEPFNGMLTARQRAVRYCAMDDYTMEIIYTYGGAWTETEVLGNQAVVKIRTRQAILNMLDQVSGFVRLPKDRLDDPLSDLNAEQITHLRDILLDAGYTLDEIHDSFVGGIENYTLRDYLHFLAQRRLRPRYDPEEDIIYCDGEVQACRSIESVDEEVQE